MRLAGACSRGLSALSCCWHAEALAALLAALVPKVFVLGAGPEGNGGSGGPLEESLGRSTSLALACGVSNTPAASTA